MLGLIVSLSRRLSRKLLFAHRTTKKVSANVSGANVVHEVESALGLVSADDAHVVAVVSSSHESGYLGLAIPAVSAVSADSGTQVREGILSTHL